MHSLTQLEAVDRAAAVVVETYSVDVDVTSPESFRSTATVRFRATRPGDTTFVEIKPTALRSVTLNGAPLDVAALDGNRLVVGPLAGDNELVVDADMAYSNSGEGLHRFVDPADGGTYLYAMSFLDEAQRIFACFDQPDLKARFTLAVTAPSAWTVAANAPVAGTTPAGTGTTRWEFAESKPLATYFVSFIAGPYHRVEGTHDGIPLAVYCKRSLAPHLDRDADEILEVTGQCLDRFHELFRVRYPFGKYDQAFVPEFNAGAMENPGLVTIRDDFVFRSAVTDSERELRATTIAHEMAHMWFGDLVTMRWWDDLWLNESFAEYMGTRVTAEATRFRGAWTTFGMRRKGWGYNADQRPSTHPIAPAAVTDAAEALTNFDGISYAKGASVLRQLTAWVGDEAFLAGVRAHFAGHGYGNATLAELLSALSAASGRDLSGWARDWLRTAQLNRLASEVTVDEAGSYADVAIAQAAPASHPTLRPHRIGVGLYDDAADGTTLRERVEVDVLGARTALPGLTGRRAADLLLLNDGDLTFAKVRLDPASASAVPRLLPRIRDPLARAVVWTATIDAVRDAELPVTALVDLMTAALPGESEVAIVTDMVTTGRNLVERYLAGDARRIERARIAGVCDTLTAGRAGPSIQLAAIRGLVAATLDAARLRGWLAGDGVPGGLVVDADLRWRVVYRLAVLGGADEELIAAELAADRSALGEEWAARSRSGRPDIAAKRRAWQILTEDFAASNRVVEATAEAFFQPEQDAVTDPYVHRFFAEMPQAARHRTAWVAERVAELAYPRFAVAPRTRELAAGLLARDDLVPGLRRAVTDLDDDLRLALAAAGR